MIDQKYFDNSGAEASLGATIPIIDHSQPVIENIGVGMYPSLMGTFNCHAVILMIGSSLGRFLSLLSSVPFHTFHLGDPWTLPSLSASSEDS